VRASPRSPFTFAALSLLACLSMVAAPAAAGPYDGSRPFLCAVATVMECDGSGQCERHVGDASSVLTFIRIDVGARTVTAANRRTTLGSATRLDGQLILQGGENGRGWSATVEEETGQMAAAIVDNDHTFSLFGGCTIP
jgi:hypothetical protein